MKIALKGPRLAMFLLAVVAYMAPVSEAGWGSYGSYGSSGGSSGGSTGYGSTGYGSTGYGSTGYGSSGYSAPYRVSYSYGSSGSYGSGGSSGSGGHHFLGGLFRRVHSHFHHWHQSHHSSYSSYGSYGSSGGSSGYSGYSYGSSGGSSGGGSSGSYVPAYGSSGGSSGGGSSGVYHSAMTGSSSSHYAAKAVPSFLAEGQSIGNEAHLTIAVPDAARVFVNDKQTSSSGPLRQYVSRGLESGRSYRFQIRAEMERDGELVSEDREIILTAGQKEEVAFALLSPDKPVETALTLHVPADAEVTLAGSDTKAEGETRTFRTMQLKPGQVWDDYTVIVRYRDGEKVVTKQEKLRLIAGDKLELTIGNSEDRIASR